MMEIKLLIFFMGLESSYAENQERAVDGFGDTLQWLIRDDAVWRIKTFAIDEDVHPHKIVRDDRSDEAWLELARKNTEKHYGDVIHKQLLLTSEDGVDGLRNSLSHNDLEPNLNIGKSGLIFWSPSASSYSTKSDP